MDIGDPIEIVDVYGDGEPPKIRTIKYYLIALAIFIFLFIFYISHELYKWQTTRMITFTLPLGSELYYDNVLLQRLKQPNENTILYSCRLPYGKHVFAVIDSLKMKYPIQFELKKSDNKLKGFIFNDGAFITF